MRHRKLLSVLIAFLAIIVLSVPGLAGRPVVQASPVEQSSASPPCRTYGKVSTQPNTMLFGEVFTTTIRVDAACPEHEDALHVVLVLDGSGSMAGGPSSNMKKAATSLVWKILQDAESKNRVGVVGFNFEARIYCQLTEDLGRARSCIGRIPATGGTAIDKGIRTAHEQLLEGRSAEPGGRIKEVIVVYTEGENHDDCIKVVRQADSAKKSGIQLFSACPSNECNHQCMLQIASRPSFYHRRAYPDASDVIWKSIDNTVLREIAVTSLVPDHMEPIVDSISNDGIWDKNTRTILWHESFFENGGTNFTYRLRGTRRGSQPVGTAIWANSTDLWGQQHREDFSVPRVLILGGRE